MMFGNIFIFPTSTGMVVDLTSRGTPVPAALRNIESHIDGELREVLSNMRRIHDSRKVLLYPITIVDVTTGDKHEELQFKGPGWSSEEFDTERQMLINSGRPYAVYGVTEGVLNTIVEVRTFTVGY